jgi:hypothetical protein
MASEKNGHATPLEDYFKEMREITVHDEQAEERYPVLFELVRARYVEGRLMYQEGRITITQEGPQFVVALECPTADRECRLGLTSLVNALDELEKALATNGVTWKQSFKKRKKDLTKLRTLLK